MMELIHTSAPCGLVDSAAGYTTVACTKGMSPDLMAQLEQGSSASVRRLRVGESAEAAAVYRIWQARGATGPLLIITRVVPISADYTGRQARLSHHFVLTENEATPRAIRFLFEDPTSFRDQWIDSPSYLPVRQFVGRTDAVGEVAQFERFTDHAAAWIKHLAMVASSGRNPPATVLVPIGFPIRECLCSIAVNASRPIALKIETSIDHIIAASPSLLILVSDQSARCEISPLADWTKSRGTAQPPQSSASHSIARRGAANVGDPHLDLSQLAEPMRAGSGEIFDTIASDDAVESEELLEDNVQSMARKLHAFKPYAAGVALGALGTWIGDILLQCVSGGR